MTLTVRLDEALEAALDRHCAETGSTKSRVVQESLADYLMARRAGQPASTSIPVSPSYRAFADAGFIGAGELGGGPADKAAVRARAAQRLRRVSK